MFGVPGSRFPVTGTRFWLAPADHVPAAPEAGRSLVATNDSPPDHVLSLHAFQARGAPTGPVPALYGGGGRYPRHRAWRQQRDLRCGLRDSAQAFALSGARSTRRGRSHGAWCEHRPRRGRAVSLLYLPRTGQDPRKPRDLAGRHGQRHRARGARGDSNHRRHRRRAPGTRRPARARPPVHRGRRLARQPGHGHHHLRLLAGALWRLPIGCRPPGRLRRPAVRNHRRPPGVVPLSRSRRVGVHTAPARPQQDLSRAVQLSGNRAAGPARRSSAPGRTPRGSSRPRSTPSRRSRASTRRCLPRRAVLDHPPRRTTSSATSAACSGC